MPQEQITIPLVSNLETENVGSLFNRGAYIKNGIVKNYLDKRLYVTQRPSIQITHDASDTITDTSGRGLYYWESTDALYFINNDTLYKNNYSNVIGTISSGKEKIDFSELGSQLIILDSENNEAWTLTTADSLAQITDVDFPSTLAGGAVSLDGFLFVMDEDGVIYQSDLDSPTAWNALNFLEAERDTDKGVFLSKHHDNVVAFGTRTIEFFYNAANPTGSVLTRRNDIFYSLGADSHNSYFVTEDKIFFVGINETGNIGVYTLEDFKLKKISTAILDSILTNERVNNGSVFIGSGQVIDGKLYFFLTLCSSGESSYTPDTTIVYDNEGDIWYSWNTTILAHDDFGIISTAIRTTPSPRQGEGMFLNGDIYTPRYLELPVDTDADSTYFTSGYITSGYFTSGTQDTFVNIPLEIVTYPVDAGGRHNKFMRSLELLGNFNIDADEDPVTLSFSDDYYSSYLSSSILRDRRRKLTRLGKFNRRVFKINYEGNKNLRLESLEAIIDHGTV